MEKVKLSVEELAVESFSIEAEDVLGTVMGAEFAPTARTRECPCIVLTSPAVCG
jgi:hypothetical protein